MFALLNTTVAMVIALALLLEMLALPFVALWVALSIRHSLARIADASELYNAKAWQFSTTPLDVKPESKTSHERNIVNSLFGR